MSDSNNASPPTHDAMQTVVDNVDALIYVSDMDTYELLFLNKRAEQTFGIERNSWKGKRCWQVLQKGKTGPCSFCTNSKLVNEKGQANPIHIWEFQNTKTKKWFQCRDQAIEWEDGHLVRLEIATDITTRKNMEIELQQAKETAERLADTDPLTGINNRRAFFKLAVYALHSALRFKQTATLVLFDLDWFKRINDEFGHKAGDEVLQAISDIAQKSVREADTIARVGGEEFALLLPQTTAEQALILIERLRQKIEDSVFEFEGNTLQCTASFGITSTEHFPKLRSSKQLLDAMANQADDCLYQAKDKGRNVVIVAPKEPSSTN